MKTRTILCALALLAIFAAAPPAKSQEQSENPLDQIAWMVGGKWQADGDQGPDGKPFHVEWSAHWGANHRTIDFAVSFLTDGKLVPEYNGLYAYNPAKKKVIFVYTDKEGNLTEGDAEISGERQEMEFDIIGTDGATHPFRSTVVRTGSDAYDWNVQNQKNGDWTVMFALKYKRTRG